MGNASKLYERTGPIAFSTIANTVVLSPNSGGQPDCLYIGSVEVGNSTGANAECGFGIKLPNAMYKVGQWRNNNSTYTDDTTDAQSTTVGDVPLATTTNNDGFVVQALCKFDVVNLKLNTAGATGGIATPTYAAWDGSAWTSFTPFKTFDYTATSANSFAFAKPATWAPVATADAAANAGVSVGYYAIRVIWATAPGTAPIADSLQVVDLKDYVESVPDGSSIVFNANGEIRIPYRASLVGYCNVADAQNWIDIEYRMGG